MQLPYATVPRLLYTAYFTSGQVNISCLLAYLRSKPLARLGNARYVLMVEYLQPERMG